MFASLTVRNVHANVCFYLRGSLKQMFSECCGTAKFVLLCMFFLIRRFKTASELNYILTHTIIIKLDCVVSSIVYVFRAKWLKSLS